MEDEKVKEIKVNSFVQSRIREIETLKSLLINPKKGGGKNVFQTLPRHMIRRAASNDIRRIPKRLRKVAMDQKGHQKNKNIAAPLDQKEPNRRKRRNPCLLRLNSAKRQCSGQGLWLETHIWHAKRFKLEKLWNYSIPFKPNDKCYRHCLRQANLGCTIQDVSYMNCIEICCQDLDYMRTKLSTLTSKFTDAEFTLLPNDPMIKERHTFLFNPDSYPNRAMGPTTYYFRHDNTNELRFVLHLWLHPSIHDEVLGTLGAIFEVGTQVETYLKAVPPKPGEERILRALKVALNITTPPQRESQKDLPAPHSPKGEARKTRDRKVPYSRDKDYALTEIKSFQKDGVRINLLKNRLVRFKLSGRLALRVLTETLVPAHSLIQERLKAPPKTTDKMNNVLDTGDGKNMKIRQVPPWWRSYYNESSILTHLTGQDDVWKALDHLSHHYYAYNRLVAKYLPPGSVIPLFVRDPRLFRPEIKKNVLDFNDIESDGVAFVSFVTGRTELGQLNDSLEGTGYKYALKNKRDDKSEEDSLQKPDLDALYMPLTSPPGGPAWAAPFWQPIIREKVTLTKLPDHKLNALRSSSKIRNDTFLGEMPHSVLATESYVPVLLIHRPLHNRKSKISHETQDNRVSALSSNKTQANYYGAGWDLVLPSSWAMPFWIGCLYNGATPCGLNEDLAFSSETLIPHFPEHYPDTKAGADFELANERKSLDAHQKRPPKCRTNYLKTSGGCLYTSQFPFKNPWQLLVNDWNSFNSNEGTLSNATAMEVSNEAAPKNFYVLRNAKILEMFESYPIFNSRSQKNPLSTTLNTDWGTSVNISTALIPITLRTVKKGTLKPGMIIVCRCKAPQRFTSLLKLSSYSPLPKPVADSETVDKSRKNKSTLPYAETSKLGVTQGRRVYFVEKNRLEESNNFDENLYVLGFTVSGAYSRLRGSECALAYVASQAFHHLDLWNKTQRLANEAMTQNNGTEYVEIMVKHNHSNAFYPVMLDLSVSS